MARIALAVLVVLTLASVASPSMADSPRASTTWVFHVGYSTGQYTDSTDPSESVSVLMYTGASWRCTRDAVSLSASCITKAATARPASSKQPIEKDL